jgi:hypothetical protein
MKEYFVDIIIKTSRDSSDTGDNHTKSNNSAALIRLKNVCTDIIASGDAGDIKTLLSPAYLF